MFSRAAILIPCKLDSIIAQFFVSACSPYMVFALDICKCWLDKLIFWVLRSFKTLFRRNWKYVNLIKIASYLKIAVYERSLFPTLFCSNAQIMMFILLKCTDYDVYCTQMHRLWCLLYSNAQTMIFNLLKCTMISNV